VSGRSLQYYVEARDARGGSLVSSGSAASPHIVSVTGGSAAGGSDDREDPEAVLRRHEEEARRRLQPRGKRRFWFAVGLGSGAGVTTGDVEVASNDQGRLIEIQNPGLAWAPVHVAPEIGFLITDHWAISLVGRFQVYLGAKLPDYRDAQGNEAQTWKWSGAGLVRTSYRFLTQTVKPYLHLGIGVGELRHRVEVPPAGNVDTVRGGLGLAGAGFGVQFEWPVSPNVGLGLVTELNALIGFPDFTANFDLNLGFLVTFNVPGT
jgi:hypothetical protein